MVIAIRETHADPFHMSEASQALALLAKRQQHAAEPANREQATGYLRDLYRTSLLTAEEERILFERMDELRAHASRLRTMPDDLMCAASWDDLKASERELELIRNHLVESNLRLVVSVASKFRGFGTIEFQDLVSEGNSILMKAVDLFQVSYGYRFSTYATTALRRGFASYCSADRRHRTRFVSGVTEGLDHPGEESPVPYLEMETLNDINAALKSLGERERRIVSDRFGLNSVTKGKTFREIGADLGLSKERIRQIMQVALEKMRASLEKRSRTSR